MCSLLGIKKTRTTPYNPKSDGLIERFNRTLVTMVPMMIEPKRRQRDWDSKLSLALFAYRSAPQESTGETPSMMMLGREVRLLLDLTTVTSQQEIHINTPLESDYAETLRERIRFAHERARLNHKENATLQKDTYDRTAERANLEVGQFEWYFNPARTKGLTPKLQRKWHGPFLITHKLSEVTFRIQKDRNGKKMVVHADKLKPYHGETIPSWLKPSAGHTDGVEDLGMGSSSPLRSIRPEREESADWVESGEGHEPVQDTPKAASTPRNGHTLNQSPAPSLQTPLRRNPPRIRKIPQRYPL
ncbi:uncharacterized protein [Diadema setosum]|uniref:uncharacterized protein n=1 Tax=Diadema setosum TaxID=31175 RepID=UPI003B3BDF43